MTTAMILAAGLGERMRPLTDAIPKPLLEVKGKPLIQYHIEALTKAGINEIVINHARLGNMIEDVIGDGDRFNLKIQYSSEGDDPLETAGGIINALPLIKDQNFIVVNADIYTDFDFSEMGLVANNMAHLVLVDNPKHNPDGDFALNTTKVVNKAHIKHTYSGIASFNKLFFSGQVQGKMALAPLLREAIDAGQVSGQFYQGNWIDVGTPARLEEANNADW